MGITVGGDSGQMHDGPESLMLGYEVGYFHELIVEDVGNGKERAVARSLLSDEIAS